MTVRQIESPAIRKRYTRRVSKCTDTFANLAGHPPSLTKEPSARKC